MAVVGSTNDIIDGQHIVAKPDQARLVLGWEPLVSYDENFDISYDNALAENIDVVAADHYVIKLSPASRSTTAIPSLPTTWCTPSTG